MKLHCSMACRAVILCAALCAGCSSTQPEGRALFDNMQHPKLVAIGRAIDSAARDEIALTNPSQLTYMVSIEPRFSYGYAITGEDVVGAAIPVFISIQCDGNTIDDADVAIVDSAEVDADGKLRTESVYYVWRKDRWISGADAFLIFLEEIDPKQAAAVRTQLDLFKQRTAATRPTPAASQPAQ